MKIHKKCVLNKAEAKRKFEIQILNSCVKTQIRARVRSDSFRSCERARRGEAKCARETMLLPRLGGGRIQIRKPNPKIQVHSPNPNPSPEFPKTRASCEDYNIL